jgi:hypothetical protein
VYSLLDAEEYADIVVDQSPAVLADPGVRRALKDDILGFSDGIPGLLDPDSVVIMKNELGAVPNCLFTHPENIRKNRIRSQASYGGDASNRGSMMVLLGTRVITRPDVRQKVDLEAWVKRYPQLNPDDFQSDAVSAMLDWLTPPPNRTPLLYNARHLVRTGYEIFKSEGCARCHAGSFLTDNDVERLYARRGQEIGIAAPSTSGFRSLGRGRGPGLLTTPNRSIANRELQLFVAPPYDAENGLATAPGGPLRGLFGTRPVGYKTLTLRYLWGSAPYLHDGGVAVSLRPGSVPAEDRLETLLARGEADKMYGMASLLAYREQHQTGEPWPNAALSLQGLLLRSEREKILADNRAPIVPVPTGSADNPLNAPSTTSLALLGVQGIGHEFWVNDVPGGERITSLVAFLLALDDDPSDPK